MRGRTLAPELRQMLDEAREEQEFMTEIAFLSEDSAKMFASLANQVILDTTLDLEVGEDDITEVMRHYVAQAVQRGVEPNIQMAGRQVTGCMSKELIREVDRRAESLGVASIHLQSRQ